MIVGPAAERPAELPLHFGDRQIVDAREAALHETFLVELPVLVSVAAEPGARVVMPLVGESHGDAIGGTGPQFLDEAVVELPYPFTLQEGTHLIAALRKLGAITPTGVLRIDLHHAVGVAGVPGILGHTNLLRGRFDGKRRNRWTHGHGSLSRGSCRYVDKCVNRSFTGHTARGGQSSL